jgi:hypothetical protein
VVLPEFDVKPPTATMVLFMAFETNGAACFVKGRGAAGHQCFTPSRTLRQLRAATLPRPRESDFAADAFGCKLFSKPTAARRL